MWMLLDRKVRLILLTASVLIIAAAYLQLAVSRSPPTTTLGLLLQWGSALFSAVGALSLVIAAIGPWPIVWRATLKIPLASRLLRFPDVNGVWVGVRSSSYLNRQAEDAERQPPPPELMQMTIRQSWLSVRVDTTSADERTQSRSLLAFPQVTDQGARIWSTYASAVRSPAQTEADSHRGAAVLDINAAGDLISGTYFSDRGIGRHLPSSGRFELRRLSEDPESRPQAAEMSEFVSRHGWGL